VSDVLKMEAPARPVSDAISGAFLQHFQSAGSSTASLPIGRHSNVP
jgi:hypothetical protein